MSAMSGTTSAPLFWLVRAAAWEAYRWLSEEDPDFPPFTKLTGMSEAEAQVASGRFAPEPVRRIRRRGGILPGPVAVE
jgi:hypothetical protein